MRTFGPLDIVRCLAAGMNRFPNLAVTSDLPLRPQSFYAFLPGAFRPRILSSSGWRALACAENGRVRAVAALRSRSGPRSWEVSHLYAAPDSEAAVTRLLERASAVSARGGAERAFLRVDADSDIIPIARRAGFFPCYRETLYRGRPTVSKSGKGLFDADSRSVKRRAEHDHALFRIYNETTPLKARQLVGMTLEQWKDSRERAAGRSIERVLVSEGAAIGWLRTSARFGTGRIETTLRPDYLALTPDILDYALASLAKAKSVVVLTPDYVPLLGNALEERRFSLEGEFAVLVKSVALMERRPAVARTSLVAE